MFFTRNRSQDPRLTAALKKIEELEAWKTQAVELLGSNARHSQELSGEIAANLRGSSEVSRNAAEAGGRMAVFDGDFQGAFEELGRMDGQISDLDRHIATVGAAVDQTSAAIEEITASINRISGESTSRFSEIRDLAELAQAGQVEMSATTKVIRGVTSGIDDLRKFIEIIDDIAGKTAILSMNAAIQAAHAGTAGKHSRGLTLRRARPRSPRRQHRRIRNGPCRLAAAGTGG